MRPKDLPLTVNLPLPLRARPSCSALAPSSFTSHGGPQVSSYLRTNLAPLLESCKPADIAKEVDEYRALGGYLKRYRGGPLDRFRAKSDETEEGRSDMGLDEMCVLAFLQVSG